MKNFLIYLKQHRMSALAFIICVGIFAFTFALYKLPMAAVLYPSGLCLAVLVCFMIADFVRTVRKHKRLSRFDVQTDTFPASKGLIESDYQRIIELLDDEHRKATAKAQDKFFDMVNYYTVWVHQIKTPIASMRLHLQSEDSESARRLLSELGRVEQYVEMVLAFLRIDMESTDLVIRSCDLDGIVRPAARKFAGDFIGRKLKLNYAPLNTSVLTDEKWLSFVVEQVISNALKYTFEGGVSVYLENGKTLCIEDTGIGIAPEDLPRIFENGFTGYNGRADKKASGIGLYLCKRVCTKLGHTISAESVVGKGTKIMIDLSREELEVE